MPALTSTPVPAPTNSPTPAPTATPTPTLTPLPTTTPIPTTEVEVAFNRLIPALLEKWDIPGASVAIAKDGNLVFARGYGLANIESREPVHADTLFRIASISKPVTAVAVLTLVEDGLLGLEDRVFRILADIEPAQGGSKNPELDDITVRQLLQHSGGWDRDESYDAMWIAGRVERELDLPQPVTCRDVIRFMLGQPLDFEPDTRFAYSNFGYCLLGRVIEEKSGEPYEEFVRARVFEPLGINRMAIGATLFEGRQEGEATYYAYPGEELAHSVLPGTPRRVPWPYGGFHLKTMDSHGGWVASAIDLVRFATALDGSRSPTLLDPVTVDSMVERPDLSHWSDSAYYYGMGWNVRPAQWGANWWHFGSQPGTQTLLVRTYHGFAWAALFNQRQEDASGFISEVDNLMWHGVSSVDRWPSEDLFPSFGYE